MIYKHNLDFFQLLLWNKNKAIHVFCNIDTYTLNIRKLRDVVVKKELQSEDMVK